MEKNCMEPLTVRGLIKRLLHECDDLDMKIIFYFHFSQEALEYNAGDIEKIGDCYLLELHESD